MMGRAFFRMYDVTGVGKRTTRGMTAQKLHGTKTEHRPQSSQDCQFLHLDGHHLRPVPDSKLGILGSHKQEVGFIT